MRRMIWKKLRMRFLNSNLKLRIKILRLKSCQMIWIKFWQIKTLCSINSWLRKMLKLLWFNNLLQRKSQETFQNLLDLQRIRQRKIATKMMSEKVRKLIFLWNKFLKKLLKMLLVKNIMKKKNLNNQRNPINLNQIKMIMKLTSNRPTKIPSSPSMLPKIEILQMMMTLKSYTNKPIKRCGMMIKAWEPSMN